MPEKKYPPRSNDLSLTMSDFEEVNINNSTKLEYFYYKTFRVAATR